MISIATQSLAQEGLLPQERGGSAEISVIGGTPVLTAYAQEMITKAEEYVVAMKLFATSQGGDPEETEEESENTTPEDSGEDPAHHNGSPAGYPDGT